MSKIKSILSVAVVSAAAAAVLTGGVMAATAPPISVNYTPDSYSVNRTTNNVNVYNEEFSSLVASKFTVNGTKATLTAKSSGFNGNLKYVSVNISGTGTGTKYVYGTGTGASYTASSNFSGTIDSAVYVGTTYAGSDMALELSEYRITVSKS